MRITALQNKRGVTLVEVMISLVILLVVFMGLIQASLLSIENTATTVLRDEAVRLAAETVTALKSGPFDNLDRDVPPTPDPNSFILNSSPSANATYRGNAQRLGINTVRTSGNLTSIYVITVTIASFPNDNNDKQVTVEVNWDWKERTFSNGNPYSHRVVALLRNA